MKKSAIWFTVFTLVFVLGMSYLYTEFIAPFFRPTYTYSETSCVTDSVTEDMDAYDIRNKYSEAGAVTRVVIYSGGTAISHGSGVCIASNGYKTTSLDVEYTASRGSYFATNYHVIDSVLTNGYTVKVEMEEKDENGELPLEAPTYSARVLWSNKDLDVAIIYTEANFGYVSMRDNWIDCGKQGRLTESVFTIGTPITAQNRNRVTTGGIASIEGIYSYTVEGNYLDNYYEDVMDLSAEISSGNSGGGIFDKNGELVGLTTLGISYSDGGVTSFNGGVSIYPIMKVIDKVIYNNEVSEIHKIYDLEKLKIKGYDGYEATIMKNKSGYLDGKIYSDITFDDYGYYIESSSIGINKKVITEAKLTRESETIAQSKILDRNDLIYILLRANAGDKLLLTIEGGAERTVTLS